MPRSVQGLVDHAILCPSPSDLRLLLHPLAGLVGKDFFPFSQELTMHTGQKKNHMMLLGQLGRPCLYASIRAKFCIKEFWCLEWWQIASWTYLVSQCAMWVCIPEFICSRLWPRLALGISGQGGKIMFCSLWPGAVRWVKWGSIMDPINITLMAPEFSVQSKEDADINYGQGSCLMHARNKSISSGCL